jgi:hypothetical protein
MSTLVLPYVSNGCAAVLLGPPPPPPFAEFGIIARNNPMVPGLRGTHAQGALASPGGPAGAGSGAGGSEGASSPRSAASSVDEAFEYEGAAAGGSAGAGSDGDSDGDGDGRLVPSAAEVAALGVQPGAVLSPADRNALLRQHRSQHAAAEAAKHPPTKHRTKAAINAADAWMGTKRR